MTEILESISMWGGVAGTALSVITIFFLVAINSKIRNALNKDKILFDQNFELKKSAIEKAMSLVDEVEKNGSSIVHSQEFSTRALECYNQLLCVTTNLTIVSQFQNITMAGDIVTSFDIAKFKLGCRKDIGLSVSNFKLPKKAKPTYNNMEYNTPVTQTQPIPMQQPVQPVQPIQPARPVTPKPIPNTGVRTVTRPAPGRPVTNNSMQNPVRPATSKTLRKTDHQ